MVVFKSAVRMYICANANATLMDILHAFKSDANQNCDDKQPHLPSRINLYQYKARSKMS